MKGFWIHLKDDPRVDQLWGGHDFDDEGACAKCGLDYWEWFEAPDEIKCD